MMNYLKLRSNPQSPERKAEIMAHQYVAVFPDFGQLIMLWAQLDSTFAIYATPPGVTAIHPNWRQQAAIGEIGTTTLEEVDDRFRRICWLADADNSGNLVEPMLAFLKKNNQEPPKNAVIDTDQILQADITQPLFSPRTGAFGFQSAKLRDGGSLLFLCRNGGQAYVAYNVPAGTPVSRPGWRAVATLVERATTSFETIEWRYQRVARLLDADLSEAPAGPAVASTDEQAQSVDYMRRVFEADVNRPLRSPTLFEDLNKESQSRSARASRPKEQEAYRAAVYQIFEHQNKATDQISEFIRKSRNISQDDWAAFEDEWQKIADVVLQFEEQVGSLKVPMEALRDHEHLIRAARMSCASVRMLSGPSGSYGLRIADELLKQGWFEMDRGTEWMRDWTGKRTYIPKTT